MSPSDWQGWDILARAPLLHSSPSGYWVKVISGGRWPHTMKAAAGGGGGGRREATRFGVTLSWANTKAWNLAASRKKVVNTWVCKRGSLLECKSNKATNSCLDYWMFLQNGLWAGVLLNECTNSRTLQSKWFLDHFFSWILCSNWSVSCGNDPSSFTANPHCLFVCIMWTHSQASKGQGCSLHRRHVYPTLPLVHPLLSRHLCAHFQYFSPSSTVPTDSFLEITRMGGFQGVV